MRFVRVRTIKYPADKGLQGNLFNNAGTAYRERYFFSATARRLAAASHTITEYHGLARG